MQTFLDFFTDPGVIVSIIASIAAGLALAQLIARSKARRLRENLQMEAASLQSEVQHQLSAAISSEAEARDELKSAQDKIDRLNAELRDKSEQCGKAEAKAERIEGLERDIQAARDENAALSSRLSDLTARLEEERKAATEKLALVEQAKTQLSDAFKALSAEALKSNNEEFLKLARTSMERYQEAAKGDLDARRKAIDELVRPVGESLKGVDAKLQALEKERHAAYQGLVSQVKSLGESQDALKGETARLATALRRPHVRGRWGEIQLRNVVEMAGMSRHCDFTEQSTMHTDDGQLRPDMIVRLPGGKTLVVDAKAPLDALLSALEAQTKHERDEHMNRLGVQINDHITKLGSKNYAANLDTTPDFVIMFLPGEAFFSAALEVRPELIEKAVAKKVIPASPTTLIAMLKSVSYGWQQERIAESAREVAGLGRELYERLSVMAEHFSRVGKGLDSAVGHYNKAVSSLESRVLVTARKFRELGVEAKKDVDDVPPVESRPREIQIPEMQNGAEALPASTVPEEEN